MIGQEYEENSRVMLENGDIVQSTVSGNTNDPNTNTAGWVRKGNSIEVESIVEMLDIQNPDNGMYIFVKSLGLNYKFDTSQAAVNNGGTVLNGWVAQNLKYVTPEMFGADPTGATSSRLAVKNMLNSLAVGGVLELKPNAIYYNDAPNGTSDVWVLDKDKTYIIANGATFKRRATSPATSAIDHDLAALKVVADSVTIGGKIYFDGSESYAPIVDGSGNTLASGDYVRGYASSHGLHLFGADNFTAKTVESINSVFNIFADGCVGLTIKGKGKSSGQVYPVTGVDLNLGSGIKLAYSIDFDIDLHTEYAGYCGVEIEPACRFGKVVSVARHPSHHGVSYQGDCEGSTVMSICNDAKLGASLRLGAGSRQITGSFSAKDCFVGLWVEPSASDNTTAGDISLCDVVGSSSGCPGGGLLISNTPAGGRLRESSLRVRSNADGGGQTQAITLENAEDCSFDVGVKTAKQAVVVNRVYDSELHIAYMSAITDANPMFFTSDNTIDVSFKQGATSYDLRRTNGHIVASSLISANAALPVSTYDAFDIRASQIIAPSLPTSSAGTLSGGLWVDSADGDSVKRKP
jgi:hypothetical protein